MKVRGLLTACLAGTMLLLLGVVSGQAQECETCYNVEKTCHQDCTWSDGEGRANGADCNFAVSEQGCIHCQWEGECGENQEDQDFASVLVSPAGTTPDPGGGAIRVQGDRIVMACSGLVLTHVDYTWESAKTGHKSQKPDVPPILIL